MNAFFQVAAGFAALCFVAGMLLALIRIYLGPAAQDRVLAFDAFYNNGMLTLLMLGIRSGSPVYFDVAILIAVFGFIGTTALAKFLLRGEVVEP